MSIKARRSGGAHEPHEISGSYVGAPRDALAREEQQAHATINYGDRLAGLRQSAAEGNHIYMTRDELDDLYG